MIIRIPGHPDDYKLMSHNCVTVSVDALVDGSGDHPTLDRLKVRFYLLPLEIYWMMIMKIIEDLFIRWNKWDLFVNILLGFLL